MSRTTRQGLPPNFATVNLNKIVLVEPIADFRDYKAGRYQGQLSLDGKGVILTTPRIPLALCKDAAAIHNRLPPNRVCNNTVAEHCAKGASIVGQTERAKSRKVYYRCPAGVTVSKRYFNEAAPQDYLMPMVSMIPINLEMMDSKGKPLYQLFPFAVYKLCIEENQEGLQIIEKSDVESHICNAFVGM
jgi:hypothetical protein